MTVYIFAEGGGEKGTNKRLATELRNAFRMFFTEAGIPKEAFTVIRCGGRSQAFTYFKNRLHNHNNNDVHLLLVDSEGPVVGKNPSEQVAWTHVQRQDGWRPPGTDKDHLHLMVQCMESWFLADPDALKKVFPKGFNENCLPRTQPVEAAAKKAVLDGLNQATEGRYEKGTHAFKVLAHLDPEKVRRASPWADRLLKTLEVLTQPPPQPTSRKPAAPRTSKS